MEVLIMMDLNYYNILSSLSSTKVQKQQRENQKKKQKLVKGLRYDVPEDDYDVDVIPLTETAKVKTLRNMILTNNLAQYKRDWFHLENQLLDKYFLTGKMLSTEDMARIMTLNLKPIAKFLVDNDELKQIIIHSEEPWFRERFKKNLELLQKRVNLNRQEYLKMVEDNSRLSRYELLKKASEKGGELKHIDSLRQELKERKEFKKRFGLKEEDLREVKTLFGRDIKVKRLETLSRGLKTYESNLNKYHDVLQRLEEASISKLDVYKTWCVTPNERTRHRHMDGVTVKGLDTPFKVIHDKSSAVDYLQYPGDFNNDYNNCANTCNCLCYYETSIKK